jgi:hypothetical protein
VSGGYRAPAKKNLQEKENKQRKMPLAGTDREARARAHYGWARRYAKRGERMDQAIAHFGRALEYTRFGAHGIGLESYYEMLEKYEHFGVVTAANGYARFPNSSRENERALYDEMRADAGSKLVPGPRRIPVNVELRPGEPESMAFLDGKLVKVNLLGNLLWKLRDLLAKPYDERSDSDIYADRYTTPALYRCSQALGDPFRVSIRDANTPEREAKEKADLCAMLSDRYPQLRVKPRNFFVPQTEGAYKYWIIPFFDVTKSPVKTQLVEVIAIQGADGVSYQLVFCTNGFIYWYLRETPSSSG